MSNSLVEIRTRLFHRRLFANLYNLCVHIALEKAFERIRDPVQLCRARLDVRWNFSEALEQIWSHGTVSQLLLARVSKFTV